MTNKQKVDAFRKIVNEMADLYEKKNENYGDSFGKLYDELGPEAGLVPLHNKLDRLTNLIKSGKNSFESVEDTLKDLACYAIMNLIEMKEDDDTTNFTPFFIHNDYFDGTSENLKDNFEPKDPYDGLSEPCKSCIYRQYQISWYSLGTATSTYNPCQNCKHNKQWFWYSPTITCTSNDLTSNLMSSSTDTLKSYGTTTLINNKEADKNDK